MSEIIKITVVMDNEKQNTEKQKKRIIPIVLTQESSMTIMSVLQKNNLLSGSFCGGRGDCGRCAVQFLEGAPLPTALERSRLEPEELRQGFRLACVTRPQTNCVIRIPEQIEREIPIVTEVNLLSEKIDLNSQRNKLSKNQISFAMKNSEAAEEDAQKPNKNLRVIPQTEVCVMKSSGNTSYNDMSDTLKLKQIERIKKIEQTKQIKQGNYIVAVDLGTTTIAMQLRDMASGEVLDTYCALNPQRSYGTDVLSRIQASCDGHREELRRLVCETLLRGVRQFAARVKTLETEHGERVKRGMCVGRGKRLERGDAKRDGRAVCVCMCIAGNTTMEHLLLGYDVSTLGRSPFAPVEIGVQEMPFSVLLAGKGRDDGSSLEIFAGVKIEAGAETESESKSKSEGIPAGWDFPVYIAPGISAFVGGDIVAGLYALDLLSPFGQPGQLKAEPHDGIEAEASEKRKAEPHDRMGVEEAEEKENMRAERQAQGHAALLIDLGTNGEMALTDGKRMLVTATAAGPAFEGGGSSGLIGTDRIALTAALLRQGKLDATGLLAEPYFSGGVPVETFAVRIDRQLSESEETQKSACYFMQKDIRDLQMAKAAVRAGVEILWEKLGRPEIGAVYLAGGFGYDLDVEAALAIGLLSERLRGRIRAVGNTALEGAYRLGRDLAAGILTKSGLEASLAVTENGNLCAVNLAGQEGFEPLYLKYMDLERN